MAEKSGKFAWTQKSRLAAELVAEDEFTDSKIAAKVGIGPRTLYRWKRSPEFAAEVQRQVEAFGRIIRSRGIARLEMRIRALNDRWERMNRIIDERAADPAMADLPGGKTGLLVRRVKRVGRGDDARVVEWFEVDCKLLRLLLHHEKQAAQELGQWGEKTGLTSEDKPAMIKVIRIIQPLDLAEGSRCPAGLPDPTGDDRPTVAGEFPGPGPEPAGMFPSSWLEATMS